MVCLTTTLTAAEPGKTGDPGTLKTLIIETGRLKDGGFTLAGRDAGQQLLVTGRYASGQLRDLTARRQVRRRARRHRRQSMRPAWSRR